MSFKVLIFAGISVFLSVSAIAKDRKPASTRLCGLLDASTVGPSCAQGQVCPHFLRLQYFISNDSGKQNVETQNSVVLNQFSKYKGDYVCAVGTSDSSNGYLDVTAVALNDKTVQP